LKRRNCITKKTRKGGLSTEEKGKIKAGQGRVARPMRFLGEKKQKKPEGKLH